MREEMKKYIPYVIIAVLLVSLFVSLTNRKEVVIEKITSDTVYITKIDTFKALQPIFKRDTIVDTIFIENNAENGLKLPITQRYYSEPNRYDIWVSGYKPNLDSCNIYNQTKYVTITNTVTKEIYPKATDFYLSTRVGYIKNQISPNIGLDIKFRNDMMIGGEIGYYDKGMTYGIKIGYKLNNR